MHQLCSLWKCKRRVIKKNMKSFQKFGTHQFSWQIYLQCLLHRKPVFHRHLIHSMSRIWMNETPITYFLYSKLISISLGYTPLVTRKLRYINLKIVIKSPRYYINLSSTKIYKKFRYTYVQNVVYRSKLQKFTGNIT